MVCIWLPVTPIEPGDKQRVSLRLVGAVPSAALSEREEAEAVSKARSRRNARRVVDFSCVCTGRRLPLCFDNVKTDATFFWVHLETVVANPRDGTPICNQRSPTRSLRPVNHTVGPSREWGVVFPERALPRAQHCTDCPTHKNVLTPSPILLLLRPGTGALRGSVQMHPYFCCRLSGG